MARIALFEGVGKGFSIKHVPLPTSLKNNEVLVKNKFVTICGSDLQTWKGKRSTETPIVLGHEGLGSIIAKGHGRHDLFLGDRVTWSIFDRCHHCKPCTDYNIPQKCDKLFKYGHTPLAKGTGLDGCYSTHILLRTGTHIAVVPNNIPDKVAAPINCAFATMHAALDPNKLPKKIDSVLVQGAGLLGIYACLLLSHLYKAKHIFCADYNKDRLQLVEKFGAIPLPAHIEEYEKRKNLIQKLVPGGVDLVIEVCGDPGVFKEGLEFMRHGGHYALIGMVHPGTQLGVSGWQIIQKCATIQGTHNYGPSHLDSALSFLSTVIDKYPFDLLISEPYELEKVEMAFEEAKEQRWPRVCLKVD